jgi:hypothetical protein
MGRSHGSLKPEWKIGMRLTEVGWGRGGQQNGKLNVKFSPIRGVEVSYAVS